MTGAAGLLTIQLKASRREQVETFCNGLERFLMAVSWGGHESLAFPACAAMAEGEFDPAVEKHRMVRLYIGLEDPAVLMEDLAKALQSIG